METNHRSNIATYTIILLYACTIKVCAGYHITAATPRPFIYSCMYVAVLFLLWLLLTGSPQNLCLLPQVESQCVVVGSNTQCVLQIFALLDNHLLPAGHVVSQSVCVSPCVCVEQYSVCNIMDHFCIELFIRNELTALGRAVSFEACCQWVLLSVQITRLVTLPYYLLYRSTFILLSVKRMLGHFVLP